MTIDMGMTIIISINYFVGPLFFWGVPRSTFRFPQRHGSMGRPLAPQRTRARTRSPPRDESGCGRRRGGHGELQRRGQRPEGLWWRKTGDSFVMPPILLQVAR